MSIVNQELARISQRRGQYDLSSLVSKTALAQAEAALAGSTFFDIETGGLKPEHGVYEAAFLHANPSGDSLTHSFFKPPQENMSKFSKDAIKARPGYDVGGKELGVAELIKQGGSQSDFKEMFKNQAGGRDLWIHNLPFESRFVDSLMGKGEFENWATANKLESFTKYSPRLFETPVAIKELTAAAEARGNARIFSTDEFLGGWEKVFGGFRNEFLTPKPQGVTRAVDSMTLTKSIFAMAQLRGHMPKTGELFAGSSVDSLAKAAFGIGELHTAADDAFLQRDLTKFLFSTGLQMESGEELTDTQKAFFQKIGAEQQGVKQRAAVANTIKVYNAQMQFVAGGRKDRGLLSEARTDSGNVSRTLSLKTYDPKSGKYVQREIDAHFRQPFNPDNTTESIDEWVASRKKIEEGRHGISPDWDEALKTVKRDYIPRFHRKVKARTKLGISKPDAIKSVATSNYAERLGNQVVRGEVPEPVTHGLTKTPNRIKGIIAKNWKVGVGAGALLALASQFSGKDDEYNYIEGLKHQGFAGETRRYNTDFGSGIQNFFRAASQRAGKTRSFRPSIKTLAGLAEGTREISSSRIRPNKTFKVTQPERDDIAGRIAQIQKIGLQNEYQTLALNDLSNFVKRGGINKADWRHDRILGGHGFNKQSGPIYEHMGLAIRSGNNGFAPTPIGFYLNIENRGGTPKTIGAILDDLKAVARRDSPEGKAFSKRREAHQKVARQIVDRKGFDPYVSRVQGLIFEYSRVETRSSSFDLSAFLKGEEGWRAHSTQESGIEGIFATNRLLPGNRNQYHNPGDVGVYASALTSDVKSIHQVAAATYGEHTVLIPPKAHADSAFRTSEFHEITTNAGFKLKGLKEVGQDIAYEHKVDYDWIYSSIREGDPAYQRLNFKRNFLKNSEDLPLKRQLKMAYEVSDLELAFKPNLELAEIEAKKGWEGRISIPKENPRTYYTVDDVEKVNYNPDHRARPTKIISEEGGGSLAFGHAEELGLSHPDAPGAMDGVFNIAKEIEALGGQLHIKGGVARERLVSKIRPEWARQSKDIDLLVTGDVPMDKVYGAMEKHQAFFDVQTTSSLDHFFPTTDSSLNQAVIRVGGDRSEQLIATKGAIEDIFTGRQRYLDFADPSRANQRMQKLEGNYPGLTTTRGEIPEMNQPYAIISGNDDVYNTIEGLRHQGFAGANRKKNTDFGSGWQGLDVESVANFVSRSSIQRDPNEGLSKREDDERPVAQVGIRSYRVEDADTVHLMLSGGNEMTLRLAGIDAPETMHEGFNPNPLQDQAYGSRATSKLEDILDEQSNLKVLFSPTGSDTYGRTAGLLIGDGGANINLELVRQGAANALPYGPSSERLYSTSEFAKAEQEALAQERGMWGYAEWQAAQRAQSNSRRMTNATLADPQDIYQNFRAASVLQRMRNPDADFSEMMASGGKDDHNIIEGLGHGWANARRKDDIADFGSGYVIDRATRIPARSVDTKIKLQRLHSNARTYVKQMFDRENYMGHHRG